MPHAAGHRTSTLTATAAPVTRWSPAASVSWRHRTKPRTIELGRHARPLSSLQDSTVRAQNSGSSRSSIGAFSSSTTTTIRPSRSRHVTTDASSSAVPPPWRPAAILDEWVKKEARPISLKQLTFFGRTLTKDRLISSGNYIREELPVRLAHRLRDMQTLPYVVVSNPQIAHVYERYYAAFETFRRVPRIQSMEDNDAFCRIISKTLEEHLTVIPRLAMGVLECQSYMPPEATDRFMTNMLRARISRRVIAEQHLALTDALKQHAGGAVLSKEGGRDDNFVGEVFLKCRASDVVEGCARVVSNIAKEAFGQDARIPEVKLKGDLEATFPYILSHLEYMIGELLRNSFSATFEWHGNNPSEMPPIEVLIVEAPQHVIFRFSDQGGGIPTDIMPTLWSYSKGPRSQKRLENLSHVPKMAATMQELDSSAAAAADKRQTKMSEGSSGGTAMGSDSLIGLASRPPGLRLGMGLPMSRVYAEYWAGSLSVQNLSGYGTDVFLQISKLGNKNEQLTTRASMDAL